MMFNWFANRKQRGVERRLEALSAYLDGALPASERSRLERQLSQDAGLRRELEELRRTVKMVRMLPTMPAPRSFTLDPAVYRKVKPRRVYLYPALRAATVMATVLLVVLFMGQTLIDGLSGARAPARVAMEPEAALVEKEMVAEETPAPAAIAMEVPAETVVEVTVEVELMEEVVVESEATSAATPSAAGTMVAAAPLPPSAPTASPEMAASSGMPGEDAASKAVPGPTLAAAEPTEEALALAAGVTATMAFDQPDAYPAPEVAQGLAEPSLELLSPTLGAEPEAIEATRAERLEEDQAVAPAAEREPFNWWLIAQVGAGVLAVGLLAVTLLARRLGW